MLHALIIFFLLAGPLFLFPYSIIFDNGENRAERRTEDTNPQKPTADKYVYRRNKSPRR